MRRASSTDLLASVPLFAACSKKELAALARAAEERTLPAGTVVVREGAAGDAFYVVVAGQARVTRGGRTVATLGPGDFFGDLALLDRAPRNATVTTTADADLVVLGQRTFLTMVDESPAFARKLLLGLARRLRDLDAQNRP
jgi:CRP/FNR family cyclic AMP-dependent transcriptional regulator